MLESLSFSHHPKLSESALITLISRCTDLTRIVLSDCNIFDVLVDVLARHCKRLKHARFGNCPNLIESSLLMLLAHLRCLNYMAFRGCGIAITDKEGLRSQIRRHLVCRRLIISIDGVVQ